MHRAIIQGTIKIDVCLPELPNFSVYTFMLKEIDTIPPDCIPIILFPIFLKKFFNNKFFSKLPIPYLSLA